MSLSALRPALRTTSLLTPRTAFAHVRNANYISRPKRPHLMDQLVILSDGSSYKQLTTSPRGVIRSNKDVRNNALWNPSLSELRDVEEDEAGRLRGFRERFGWGFEAEENAEGDKEK